MSGFIIWLTGLSGSGKTTLSTAIQQKLSHSGLPIKSLDGDEVREQLCFDLGFSKKDRDQNVLRIGYVAKMLADFDVVVLVSAISPYRDARDLVRQTSNGRFVEVFVDAPLATCEERDVKGLYHKARRGEIQSFTGISDPYEYPRHPEVVCHTDLESIEESADKVVRYVSARLGIVTGVVERTDVAQSSSRSYVFEGEGI